jgi:hypothetical protein
MANGDIAKGFVLGAAAMLVGRLIIKTLPVGGQPLAHAALRGGAVLAAKAREAAAEIGEIIEDTLAELQAAQHDSAPAPAATAAESASAATASPPSANAPET